MPPGTELIPLRDHVHGREKRERGGTACAKKQGQDSPQPGDRLRSRGKIAVVPFSTLLLIERVGTRE